VRSVRALGIASLLTLVAAVGCTDAAPAASSSEPSSELQAVVHTLDSIQDLRDRFEEDAGKVRLILLISPT
jgi:ABC-type glycerol-3-phosphate transport system substrate-binding protein